MHLIIGNKIADALFIEDKTSFLLGNIAPDAVFSLEEKNSSHFFVGAVEDFTRRVDDQGFLEKYRLEIEKQDPYIFGYYTHLIADDIFLKGFNLSWLRNRMAADEGLYQLYHHDFRLLNGKLLEYYGFTDELKKQLCPFPTVLDLEEVKAADVEKFLPVVLGDMEYDKTVINEPLHVFTFNQIIGYLETSVELGLHKMKAILIK